MTELLLRSGAEITPEVRERVERYYNWTGDPIQDRIRKLLGMPEL